MSWEVAVCRETIRVAPVHLMNCTGTRILDESEPDTLFYDDNGQSFSIGSISHYYSLVRFTPSADFQLRSIYIGIRDSLGSMAPCSIWVYLPNGQRPGQELAAIVIDLQVGAAMYDITLSDGINFSGGQDFMIVVGRSPGPSGWSPLLDGGSTVNRSYVTLGDRATGDYQSIPYDFRIRAGGSFQTFADASVEECFNLVNGSEPAFHVQPGDSTLFKARIRNVGFLPISSCAVQWTVYDRYGNEVFASFNGIWDLEPESERVAETTTAFIPAAAGEYLCISRISAEGDADSTNNISSFRMFAVQGSEWYHYDDSEPDGGVVHGQNWMIGVSFQPAAPARVESVRVYCITSGVADVGIYANDEQGMPGSTALWTDSRFFNEGWSIFAVNPPLTIAEGETFTAAFVFNGSIALGNDYDSPNASAMPHMSRIAWLRGATGWQADHSGNWMIQAFVSHAESASLDLLRAPVKNFSLMQNYPNPFNATTTIAYEMPHAGFVSLRVFDLSGRVAAVLTEGFVEAGSYRVSFDGRNTPSGVYFARLNAGAFSQTRKLVLLK